MLLLCKSDRNMAVVVVFLLSLQSRLCFPMNYPNQHSSERSELQLLNIININLLRAWRLLSHSEHLIKRCTSNPENRWLSNVQLDTTPIDKFKSTMKLRIPNPEYSDSKLNVNHLGKKELPFYVDEPHYIIIRKENRKQLLDNDDPFIPPRGKKRVLEPDTFFQDYSLFTVECEKRNLFSAILNGRDRKHRMKRDKLSEILKYDETFFPNRGKKWI